MVTNISVIPVFIWFLACDLLVMWQSMVTNVHSARRQGNPIYQYWHTGTRASIILPMKGGGKQKSDRQRILKRQRFPNQTINANWCPFGHMLAIIIPV